MSQDRSTSLIHHDYVPPAGFGSPAVAVHKASTVFFPNTAALRTHSWLDKSAYTYGLHGTPTTFTLEARIASLEGGKQALLAPSGLSAISLVDIALLGQGDEVLLPDNAYGPGKTFARHELKSWGITHRVYDAMDPASLEALLTPQVKLVWVEAAGSVTMEFPDLRALIAAVRRGAPQAVIALDNTWGAGIAFDAFALGVDLTVHALTKYPSGGGDLLMGSVVTADETLYRRLALAHSRLGLGVGLNDVEAVLRGLPSLPLRYAAQDAAGRQLARWCAQRPEFARVLHPALPGSPGHEHWADTCSAAAGLFTVELDLRYSPAQADAVVDALKLFRIGWSWGGPVSLAVPYDAASLRSRPVPYRGTLIRFSLGLEAVEDLQADLAQALDLLHRAP
ncbi:PLP-dependent transferase [Azohydromonas caseinilytica]|uniref:Cystathionine beta-lyase n=1 Tax=Azohydromonas caseinilytica TaxID=2728836 RepID=A0A848FAZ6_9BURK|nr:PLP-dependent transferase [Azohydromonas caseinilytica]NML15493.1 cystathionine beta-lyase [Azohydromonas caseinilytica]